MRGHDEQQWEMFSYGSLEERVAKDHPLRRIHVVVKAVLGRMAGRFDDLYAETGRPSIAPERLLRAMLLEVLYSIRSDRALMEHIDLHLGLPAGKTTKTSPATATAFICSRPSASR
jgi:transposase